MSGFSFGRVQRALGVLVAGAFALGACHQGAGIPVDLGTPTCSAPEVTEKPLRRLSNAELVGVLSSLFGDDVLEGLVLPPRVVAEDGFDTDHEALSVTELTVERIHFLADAISERVVEQPDSVLPCAVDTEDAAGCLKRFVDDFLFAAFRRPPTASQRQAYQALALSWLQGEGIAVAAALCVQTVLQSPDFLYRLQHFRTTPVSENVRRFDDHFVASRLALLVWQSAPDELLVSDAEAGLLDDPDVREAHLRRMFGDARAKAPLRDFARQWLGLRALDALAKDPQQFGFFDEDLGRLMADQTERFVARVLSDPTLSFQDLLTDTRVQLEHRLGEVYGVSVPADAEWTSVTLDSDQRAGVLTHASMLSLGANERDPSPVLRGVAVLKNFMCLQPTPPPVNVDTSVPAADDEAEPRTNRERFEAYISGPECVSCHRAFDPIGYTFESYDAVGRFRTKDNGRPVDALASWVSPDEFAGVEVSGPVEASRQLASSDAYARCIRQKMARFSEAREQGPEDSCRVDRQLTGDKKANQGYVEWLVSRVRSDDFVTRPPARQESDS